jgi:protein gp37
MGDTFEEGVWDSWLDEIFHVMEACPQHQFQILTKRTDRMRDYARRRGVMPHIWMGTSIGARSSLWRLDCRHDHSRQVSAGRRVCAGDVAAQPDTAARA